MSHKGLFILIIAALFLTCCNNQDNEKISSQLVKNPRTASGKADEKLPEFTFTEEVHDFGKIIQGEVLTYGFQFTNTGKADLLITSVVSSCGCTATKYPKKPIPSGKGGVIEVTFNSSGRKGMQFKTITISSNTQPGRKKLKIKAEVVLPEKNN